MINEKDTGALINQIQVVTRDHIDWIKSQLLKPTGFMVAKGREVWIDIPNSKLKNIVTIPSKDEDNYKEAWARVYNLAVDYLEGSLSYACMSGKLDYRMINWPDFNPNNAEYARKLEIVLDDFKRKEKVRVQMEKERTKLKVVKSSVVLEPILVKDEAYQGEAKHVKKDDALVLPFDTSVKEDNFTEPVTENVPEVKERSEFTFQKVLDGDRLTKRDLSELHDINSSLVIIPCQDVDNIKAEKLFLENMQVCGDEGIVTGAMIYGKATDEKEAIYELKKILKLFDQCDDNFSKCVIYEVNDKKKKKNKDSEMKLLSFINAYTMVAEGLSKEGYIPMLSMNLSSRKILNDIYGRYKLDSKFEIIYMVLVRELEELAKNDSTILMDPQYDYDVITLRNSKFDSTKKISEVLEEMNAKNTMLAKAA